jgi:protein kinase C substrate 80K-H
VNRKFESWNPSPDVKPGEPEYYQKQVYKHGTRCWNGPERNVVVSFLFLALTCACLSWCLKTWLTDTYLKLLLTCGTENAILTVQELEKCEYEFTGTSPALCLPLVGEQKKAGGPREEL